MGRPRKDQADGQASLRLQQAFWKLLEDHTCGELTVTLLAQTAGVNKNSFYYHYRDIDEFVASSLQAVFDASIPLAMLSAMRGEALALKLLISDSHLVERLKHVALFARRCDTQGQRDVFKRCLLDVWLQASGLHEEDLSEDDWLTLQFVLSGALDLMGTWGVIRLKRVIEAGESVSVGTDTEQFLHGIQEMLNSDLIRRIAGIVLPILFPEEQRMRLA